MPVIDTHCHLDMIEDPERSNVQILNDAYRNGVTDVVQISVSTEGSKSNRDLAIQLNERQNMASHDSFSGIPRLHYTAGIHPETVAPDDEFENLRKEIREWRQSGHPPVAIGEVGLDYYQNPDSASLQRERLESFFQLAEETKLPLVIHLRDDRVYNPDKLDTIRDALTLAKQYTGVRGVLHCYTYGYNEAKPFVEAGWMVSYSGIVTYKNAGIVREGAGSLPLSSLMVETDAPFLAPMPHRGKRNEPAFVHHTMEFLKQFRFEQNGEDPQEVERALYTNSKNFFGWN